MADEQAKKDAAAAHGRRAGQQAKASAKNVTKAAQLAAEPAAQNAVDTTKTAARAAGDVIEGTAEVAGDTAEAAANVAKHHTPRLSARGLAAITGDTGTGFLALTVALYAGAIALNRFGAVYRGRSRTMRSPRVR